MDYKTLMEKCRKAATKGAKPVKTKPSKKEVEEEQPIMMMVVEEGLEEEILEAEAIAETEKSKEE